MATHVQNTGDGTMGTDRARLAYWEQKATEGGECGDNVLIGALNRMARRDLPVLAEDADRALGLTGGTTAFFNHAGTVPAEAVIAELERRNAGRPIDPETGRVL